MKKKTGSPFGKGVKQAFKPSKSLFTLKKSPQKNKKLPKH